MNNTSLQLYNTTHYPNMCPLWPDKTPLIATKATLLSLYQSELSDIKLQAAATEASLASYRNFLGYAAIALEIKRHSHWFFHHGISFNRHCADYLYEGGNIYI